MIPMRGKAGDAIPSVVASGTDAPDIDGSVLESLLRKERQAVRLTNRNNLGLMVMGREESVGAWATFLAGRDLAMSGRPEEGIAIMRAAASMGAARSGS
jgi:hypothetical protein